MRSPMRVRPYLDLLRHNPAFTRLYAAQLISFAGDWFATVAILGLALELTGSPQVASLLLVVQTGAFAVASPIAGVLADRFDRRRLMVIADLARVPVALAFLLARDPGTLWIAFVAAAAALVRSSRLRADLIGRAAEPGGGRRAGRGQRADRLGLGHDAGGRGGARRRGGGHAGAGCGVRDQRRLVRRLGAAGARDPSVLQPAWRRRSAPRATARRRCAACATRWAWSCASRAATARWRRCCCRRPPSGWAPA